jgi:hypothetical protein
VTESRGTNVPSIKRKILHQLVCPEALNGGSFTTELASFWLEMGWTDCNWFSLKLRNARQTFMKTSTDDDLIQRHLLNIETQNVFGACHKNDQVEYSLIIIVETSVYLYHTYTGQFKKKVTFSHVYNEVTSEPTITRYASIVRKALKVLTCYLTNTQCGNIVSHGTLQSDSPFLSRLSPACPCLW